MHNEPSAEETVAPPWFVEALATPVDIGEVEVAGTRVSYRAWGQPGTPGIVLVHGGAAHARWWDHIGPLLASDRRVVALDLTGHGDSGRRSRYSLEQWAEETVTVAAVSGVEGPPVLVGHSMGGMVAFVAAHLCGADLAGVQLIDAPIRERTPEEQAARTKKAFGPLKVYPGRAEALARFRLVPTQQGALPYITAHVAETSLRQVDDGWSWKFDRAIFARSPSQNLDAAQPRCRLAYFRAERGLIAMELMDDMRQRFGPGALFTEIPAAGHHVMMDQPLALVTGIRTVLAAWAAADALAGART